MDKLSSNTHSYDSLLKKNYNDLKKIDINNLVQPINFNDTINEIYSYIRNLNFNLQNKQAIDAIILIKNDQKNNYDKENDINVEDLLPRVWRFVKNYDSSGKEIFVEQLSEIYNSGPCAQGRTTRLYQFYYPHIDQENDNDYIYKLLKK